MARNEIARLFDIAPCKMPTEVELDTKQQGLLWPRLDDEQIHGNSIPSLQALEEFTRLGEATADDIFSFVHCWGVPQAHGSTGRDLRHLDWDFTPRFRIQLFSESPACAYESPERLALQGYWQWMSLDDLRALARTTQAVLRVAARLRENQKGHAEEWRIVAPHLDRAPNNVKRERELLATLVTTWLAWDGVAPEMTWDRPATRLVLRPHSLVGTLAVLMLQAIEASASFVLCASCERPFIPNKYVGPDKRHYCPDCGRRAAVRDATRRLRARQAALPETLS